MSAETETQNDHHPFKIAIPDATIADLKERLAMTRWPTGHWTQMPRGGHFAPVNEPDLLAADVAAFFPAFESSVRPCCSGVAPFRLILVIRHIHGEFTCAY